MKYRLFISDVFISRTPYVDIYRIDVNKCIWGECSIFYTTDCKKVQIIIGPLAKECKRRCSRNVHWEIILESKPHYINCLILTITDLRILPKPSPITPHRSTQTIHSELVVSKSMTITEWTPSNLRIPSFPSHRSLSSKHLVDWYSTTPLVSAAKSFVDSNHWRYTPVRRLFL